MSSRVEAEPHEHAAPVVAVVVLTWNGLRWARSCLDSLLRTTYPSLRVYVVDNASTDRTPALIREEYPSLTLIQNARNLGFARGCNVGIRRALSEGAAYVVVLNQDTKVDPGWLDPLVEVAEADPTIGVLSPLQLDYQGEGVDPIFDKYNLKRATPLGGAGEVLGGVVEAEWVVGAAFMLSRALCERVGLFDPMYFFYYEDLDLCRRARYHRFRVAIVTRSRIYHHHGQVHSTMRSYLTEGFATSRALYFWKDLNRSAASKLGDYRRFWSSKPTGWPHDLRHRLLEARIHLWILARLPIILRRVEAERRMPGAWAAHEREPPRTR